MNRFNAANQPGSQPDILQLRQQFGPQLSNLSNTVNVQTDQQTLNQVQNMSNPQRVQTLQEYVTQQRQYYQNEIFNLAAKQHAELQPQITQIRTQLSSDPNINKPPLQEPRVAAKLNQIFERLGATPPDSIRDGNGNLTNITFPPQTYLRRTSENAGLITQAITGNTNIGCTIDAPKVKEDIDYLDSLKGQCTPDQQTFVENLKQKLIAYSMALDADNMQQWLRPRSQMDQAVGKFGRIAVFLALSVGAIVNGLISLRNKSSPTAALLMAGGAFFTANPDFLSPADQRDLNDANNARALLQNLVNTYDIQGPAWIGILNRFITKDSFHPSPALQEFIKKQPGPLSRLARDSSITNLDNETTEKLFTEFVNAPPRGADGRIDPKALTNTIDKHLYDMIIAQPREFYTLVTTLSGLQGEARQYALTSIQLGAWSQTPQQPPQPQLPPNVA